MAASFADSDAIPHFAKNGTALSKQARASIARRKGLCVQCGTKTHLIRTFSVVKRTPLTNDNVHKGVCIRCKPTSVPVKVLQDYEHRNPPKALVARVLPGSPRFTKPQPALPTTRQGIRRLEGMIANQPRTTRGQGAASDNDVIEVKGAELPEVNGIYVRDNNFGGSYHIYSKRGLFDGSVATFEFYRTAKRWYLSAVKSDGGEQKLYTAWANDQSVESPPTEEGVLWRKLGYGAADTESSLTLSVPAREDEDEDDQRKEEAAQAIQIQIVVTTGRTFYLPINTADTIRELKEAIQSLEGIPIANQVLTLKTSQGPISQGPIMEDEHSLQYYKISGDTAVQLYYPPGYPCRRLFISFLGEKHKLEVDPLDAIQTIKRKIRQSSWFVDHESGENALDLALKLNGEDLEGNLQLAEADVLNQSELQLEVVLDPSNPPSVSRESIDQAESGDAEEQGTPTPEDVAAAEEIEDESPAESQIPSGVGQETVLAPVEDVQQEANETNTNPPPEQTSDKEDKLAAACVALGELDLVAEDEGDNIPIAVAVAVTATDEEGGSGSLQVEQEPATSISEAKGRDPRTRSRGSRNRSTDDTTSVPVPIPAPTGKLAGPGLGTDLHQISGDYSQAVSPQPVAGPGLRTGHSQPFNPNINSILPADNAAGVGAGGQGRNSSGSKDGQVPLGGDSATVQKWAGLLDQLGGQIDPDRKISQYTPLPSQYMQDEAARKYHRAFEDSMYAAVTVMQMHSQGMGLPGPTILGRLVRAPIQAAGFLVSTIGEMIISIFEWQHERACVAKAKKFLEALPASNGVALERFVTRLSCTMVHTHMQRSSNNGIDQAMTKMESQLTKTGNNIAAGTMDGLSAAFTRWREAAKKKSGGSVAVDADSFNSYTAAAVVHVGLVTRALVEHSDVLDSIKGGGSSPEDMVCKLMEALEIPSSAATTIADAKSNPTVLVAGAIDATPASTTIANQASFDPKKLLEDFEEMKQRVHGVEEMKEKVERLEQREKKRPKDDNARNRVRQTTTQMQVLEAGAGEASSSFSSSNAWAQGAVAETDGNRATLFGVHAHGQVDAERSELSGEHNDRISQLEAQLAATQDHVAALLEVVALTMDTDSCKKAKQEKERKLKQGKERKRRIDLARRILQGDSRSEEEEVAEYGYKQGEGLFADDRIMEEEGSDCYSDSSSGHSDGANGQLRESRPVHAEPLD